MVYLAYGSNLHPLRLGERIASARLVDVIALPGWRLRFHKRGVDDSAKCNLVRTGNAADRAWGALFTLDPAERETLDRFEGPGYAVQALEVNTRGAPVEAFVYIARDTHLDDAGLPYDWYRDIVLAGARHLELPADYVAAIAAVQARPDPDPARAAQHAALLDRLHAHTRGVPRGRP